MKILHLSTVGIMLAVIVICASASFKSAFAAGGASVGSLASGYLPFGGKVLLTTNPAVTCVNTEGGPITITPIRPAFPPALYATTLTTKRYSNYVIKPGAWIIGLYSPIPNMTTCINPETGAPVPVLPVIIYGVSK